MTNILDPVRPYLALIKALGIVVVIAAVFTGGCRYGKASEAEAHAAAIAKKNAALTAASAELHTAANILRRVNAEAQRRKAEAERLRLATDAATRAADDAKKRLEERTRAYDEQLKRARRKPECQALLDTDLRRVCDL